MKHSKRSFRQIVSEYILAVISLVILVLLDQISKYYIDKTMNLHESKSIITNVFDIYYIRNAGAAWGIFQNKQILFYIITVAALCFGGYVFVHCMSIDRFRNIRVLIVFIAAGAVGNFIDRIRFHYVIDFLYFKLIRFPVFNIADCYVSIGFVCLLFLLLFRYDEKDMEQLI